MSLEEEISRGNGNLIWRSFDNAHEIGEAERNIS